MAKKASGGGGQGAHLASGYISLNVKYGSAMGQIASDFGVLDKKSKAAGESITKNLVAGVDTAKAKVAQLGSEYEAQRSKVAGLRSEVEKLHAKSAVAAEAEKAWAAARRDDDQKSAEYKRQAVKLASDLLAVEKQGGAESKSIRAAQVALDAQRAGQMKQLAAVEKSYRDAKGSGSQVEATKAESEAQQQLSSEVAKGKEIFQQYGKAVEDVARKQQLAATSSSALKNGLGDVNTHMSLGQRLAKALGMPYGPALSEAGTKAGQGFRRNFNMEMYKGNHEAEGHARSLANGLLMGMTPGVMGAAGVGLAVGKAFQAGFDESETIKSMQLRMKALGKSATEIQEITEMATKAVEGTQFTVGASLSAAADAVMSNVKQSDLPAYLNNVANAAGVTGAEFDEVALAIGRIHKLGVVSLEQLDPLIRRQLPVLDWIRDYYSKDFPNTTQADISDMITKKMVPADVLDKVLSAHLNDTMKKLGPKGVKGAFAEMFKGVGDVTKSILEPFTGNLPDFINKITGKLNHFAEYIKPGMERFSNWISTTWNALWPKISGVVGTAVDWMKQKWEEWWPTIKSVIDKVVAVWSDMWPQLKEKFEPWMAAVKRLWNALYPIVAPVLKVIGALAGWLAMEFIKHMPAFMQFATNLVNWMSTALEWLRTKFWPWIQEMWGNLTKAVKTSWEKIGEWKDNFLDAFDKVKTTLTTWFDWIKTKWDWLTNLSIPDALKWLMEHTLGDKGIGLMSSSTPLVQGGAPMGGPMPNGLIDSGHVQSGPQSRYTAGLILSQFPGVKSINGSYLPKSEGGPSAPGTHDAGLSIDVPIGTSQEQRDMGDQIVKYLQENAKTLGVAYTIWKNVGRNAIDNPSGAAGSTWDQGGHQDHIDVHFDGKTFGAVGSNGQNYNIAPVSMSTPMGGQDSNLIAALRNQGFNDSQITGLVALNKVETGDWSHPESIMGFTNQQTGPGITSHVAGFKEMWDRRQRTGAVSGVGADDSGMDAAGNVVDPTKFANWLLRLEGYSATQDWAGNQYAPGQFLSSDKYSSQVIGAYGGPRKASANDFGGVALSTFSVPLSPADNVTPQPPPSPPGTIGGIPIPGLNPVAINGQQQTPQTAKDVYSPAMNQDKPGFIGGIPMPGLVGDSPKTLTDVLKANGTLPPDWYPGKPDSGAGHDGSSGREHRGLAPLPKGTKDDPLHTTDAEVAENTNPDNAPKPGAAVADSPHAGSGAAPGPVPGGSNANGGKDMQNLAGGLGGVAQSAFSNQFEGTPFSNPLDWPGTKSIGALFTFFGSVLGGNTSGGASGLAGMLTPGSKGGVDYGDWKQIRDSKQRVERLTKARDDAQTKLDGMQGKANFTPEEKADAADKLATAQQELTDATYDNAQAFQDYGTKANGGGGGIRGWLDKIMGNPQQGNAIDPATGLPPMPGLPASGGSTGFTLPPFGQNTPAPGGAPGGNADQGLFTPGGSTPDLAPPAAPNADAAAPAGNNGGGGNVDLSVHQQVPAEGQVNAADYVRRAQNTTLNSSLMNVGRITV